MKIAIVDERLPRGCRLRLSELGFSVFTLPRLSVLPSALASHTDIITFHSRDTIIVCEGYRAENEGLLSALEAALPGVEFIYTEDIPKGEYPTDAIFNALIMGSNIFCKAESISKAVLNYARAKGLNIVNVKQGYPACTVLPIGDRHAVTADRGMAKALSACGIKTYVIENSESISLPPYPYGFIGGTAGSLGGVLYFAGSLEAHPDADIIKAAISDAGYEYVSLDPSAGGLFDLGGIALYDDGIDNNGKKG